MHNHLSVCKMYKLQIWNNTLTISRILKAHSHAKSHLRTQCYGTTTTFQTPLHNCTDICALKKAHSHLIISGFLTQQLYPKLIRMYAILGKLKESHKLFDEMENPNTISWNAMIGALVHANHIQKSLQFYIRMLNQGKIPDSYTFTPVIKACCIINDVSIGKQVHGHVIRSPFDSDVSVMNSLIDMYGKCGRLDFARQVFDKMPFCNVVSWTSVISASVRNGQHAEALNLFRAMVASEVRPNKITMLSVFVACGGVGDLEEAKKLYEYVLDLRIEVDVAVGTAMVDMYGKCGDLEMARRVFDRILEKDIVAWSAMLSAYSQNGCDRDAIALLYGMKRAGLRPNQVTLVSALPASADVGDLKLGKSLHGYIVRNGYDSELYVQNSLLDMYGKCGDVEFGCRLFDRMKQKDSVSWSLLISGYVHNGFPSKALGLFGKMKKEMIGCNIGATLSILQACGELGFQLQGKIVHAHALKMGFDRNASVGTCLLAMYAKCGHVDLARQLFDSMDVADVVAWSGMIASYAQNGYSKEALDLFDKMLSAKVKPNEVTMVSVIQACAHLGSPQKCREMHDYVLKKGFESNDYMATALIDMHSRCGNLTLARNLFKNSQQRDAFTWTAMIAGYGMHGHGEKAIELFSQMLERKINPTRVTFVSLLSACSHAGMVDEGQKYFKSMTETFGIPANSQHYACIVDLLGRAGKLSEAYELIKSIPFDPDQGIWSALLGACRIHCNFDIGAVAAKKLFELDPENPAYYVLLSNIFAISGKWEEAASLRSLMKTRGLKKQPGCSFVELDNKVHAFVVGDRSHAETDQIYTTLTILAGKMEEAGYVAHTDHALHDVDEEAKGEIIAIHSEKLAMAFAIMHSSPDDVIHITKNLRVCIDCHNVAKFISKIYKRTIIMRDVKRFHQFKDGLCSCRDYW